MTTFSVSEKEVKCLGRDYLLGQLFVDFIEMDLSEYETERLKIKKVLDENDEETMRQFTKKLTKPKKFDRGFGGLDYILLNISDDMSLKEKYTVYALYKAMFLIDHVYFNVVDYSVMSEYKHKILLDDFDLLSLQNQYKEAMEKCLFKDTSDRTAIKKFKDYAINVSGKAEVVFEISEMVCNDTKQAVMHEAFTASKISSLLYIEFMKMIQNNVLVSRCENCQRLFIPDTKGNYDVKYCNRKINGSDKTCEQIGAVNSFKKKIKSNPVYGEYEKAYKRYYAQKRKGVVSQEWFDKWVKEASQLKKEALKDNLSLDDFKKQITRK